MVKPTPFRKSFYSNQKHERVLLPLFLSVFASLSFIFYFHLQNEQSIYNAILAELGRAERTFGEPEKEAVQASKAEEEDGKFENAGEQLPIEGMNETSDASCFPYNSEQWLDLTSKRLGNMNDTSMIGSYDLISKNILNIEDLLVEDNIHSREMLQQTLCHQKSRLLALDNDGMDYENPSKEDIKTWTFRLIYMATHIHQHLPALPEARYRLKHSQTCKAEMESKQVGRFDFECPKAKLLVVSLGKLGIGAVMRLGAVNALIAGIASNRTVVFVNNADHGVKTVREPWPHSSCNRFDMQCFYMPATPCTVTERELRTARLLQRGDMRKLFRKGELDSSLDNERILVMDQVLRPQRTPPHLRQNIKTIIDQHIIEPLKAQRPKHPLLNVLLTAANRTLDEAVTDEQRYSYYGKASNVNHALVFYMMRPNPYYANRLEEILKGTLVAGFDPNMAMGLPIRASDKCNTESECLKFDQYMTLMDRTWEDQKSLFMGTQAGRQLQGSKSTIIVTSESAQVHDEQDLFLEKSRRNNKPFPFQILNNNFDLHQGTGDPAFMGSTGKNVSLEDIMLSSISSLQLQLQARYTVGNCCSNFHLLLFDFLEEGCGPSRSGAEPVTAQAVGVPRFSFPGPLVQALDLNPVIQLIALHTATRRGYDAILSLVGDEDSSSKLYLLNKASAGMTGRQKRASGLSFGVGTRGSRRDKNNAVLISVAQSAFEARQAYGIVEQAALALEHNDYDLSVPPFYPQDSGPMDTSKPITDDDEWLDVTPEDWTLESILQAEQVIGTLIKVRDWASLSQHETWTPSLASIGSCIDPEHELDAVFEYIRDVVKIYRASTAQDPKGKNLAENRFPVLGLLKQKERELLGRGGKDFDKAVVDLRSEIEAVESQILVGLAQSILHVSTIVDHGINKVAELDIIFAKAAFGKANQGVTPVISEGGCISISGFRHPLLAESRDEVVPVDLELTHQNEKRALVLSGPNGGGKSQSLKSFGVACILSKLGIPIPVEDTKTIARVDYFANILANIGDQQNIMDGESTWTGMLNSCARIIDTIASGPKDVRTLILLDELGSGSDPEAGGAVAQAILEQMLSYPSSHIVATTHSPRLKSLSYNSDQLQCATVLLKHDVEQNGYKIPSFQLQYGVIGDSYALGPVSRTNPPLPDAILSRASQLLGETNPEQGEFADRSNYIKSLTLSMETQLEMAGNETRALEQNRRDSSRCRSAMISLAASYELQLSRLEQRLDKVYKQLQEEGKDNFDLVGDILSEIRLVKRTIKGQKELLKERGLRMLPSSYELRAGESVVLAGEGEYDDMTVTVVADSTMDPSLTANEVLVSQSSVFSFDMMFDDEQETQFVVQRNELAIWDYEAVNDVNTESVVSAAASGRKLASVLSSLKTTPKAKSSPDNSTTTFTTSRERKAAKKKNKGSKNRTVQK